MRALICMLLLASLAFALAPQNLATAKIEITAAGKVSTVNNDALAVKIRTDPNFPLVPVQQDYVSPTTKIQSNDSGISALAGHVTSDSRKELEAAAAILTWVYNNVEYLPAEYSGVFSATQVLKMRRGVCGEFSVLAAAMLRSQGIPVKYVKGYIYTGSGFQSHAWLEIYVPGSGWIPADPTLGQLGLVDAGHVKIAEAADPTELSVLHENATELRLLNSTEFSGLFTVAMAATPSLSYGEQGLVQLNLTNLRDAYMLPSIRLGHSSGLRVENPFLIAVLAPKGEAEAYWRITPAAGEKGAYNYSLQAIGPGILEKAWVLVMLAEDVQPEAAMEIRSFDKAITKDGIVLTAEVANVGDADIDELTLAVTSSVHGPQTEAILLQRGARKSVSFVFSPVEGVDSYMFMLDVSGGGLAASQTLAVELPQPIVEKPVEELQRSLSKNLDTIFLMIVAVVLCGVGFFFLSPYVLKAKKPFTMGRHAGKVEHKMTGRPFDNHHKKQVMKESWKMLGREK